MLINRLKGMVNRYFGLIAKKTGRVLPPLFSNLVQWTEAPVVTSTLVDILGDSGFNDGREAVYGYYLSSPGTTTIKFPGYPLAGFTYQDHTTGLEVAATTDASSEFIVPSNGIDFITIDGYICSFEEGNQDEYVVGINLLTKEFAVFELTVLTATDKVQDLTLTNHLMDDYGYAVSDGTSFYYEESTLR